MRQNREASISEREPISWWSWRPGFTPRPFRTWYGAALNPTGASSDKQVMTFSISEEVHNSLHQGDSVHIIYSPHLHYVYALEPGD